MPLVSFYTPWKHQKVSGLLMFSAGKERDHTAKKRKLPIKDFFSKCDQIRRKLRIWSHLLKESLTENFIFVQ